MCSSPWLFSLKKKKSVVCLWLVFFSLFGCLFWREKKKRKSSPGGLEPPTFRLTAERANRLRHGDRVKISANKNFYKAFVIATPASMKHNSQFFAQFRFNVSCLNGSKSLELTLQLRMSNQSNWRVTQETFFTHSGGELFWNLSNLRKHKTYLNKFQVILEKLLMVFIFCKLTFEYGCWSRCSVSF